MENKVENEVENFVRLANDIARRELVWSSRPVRLEYSFNTACNLRCVMCHQSTEPAVVRSERSQGEALLAWFGEAGTIWTPSATSEPLANRLDHLLELSERHGLWIELTTNVVPLDPATLERLLPRLHRLTLSIDSHVAEVFERMRPPASFAVVRAHAEHALQRCREVGVPTQIHIVLLRENVESLAAFVDFAADLGTRTIVLLDLLRNSPTIDEHDAFLHHPIDAIERALAAMRARALERSVNLRLDLRAPHGGFWAAGSGFERIHSGTVMEKFLDTHARETAGFCPMVASYLKVTPEGDAYPCCRAPDELRLGNVFADGAAAIWNGPAMQSLRRRMFDGDLPKPCVGCTILEGPRQAQRERAARLVQATPSQEHP